MDSTRRTLRPDGYDVSGGFPESEALVRAASFVAVFAAVAAGEALAPRRVLRAPRSRRWRTNLALAVLDTAFVRALLPGGATIAVAVTAEAAGFGLLRNSPLPAAVSGVVAVIVLDLAVYVQHVVFHAVPALWRVHRVHHTDVDFDVTTGVRFHPVEIALSLALKIVLIAALGPPVVAVVVFEVLLNATSMFNHGNVRIPEAPDRLLRWLVVTPDMHRVHHSVRAEETSSNFGFNLPWWDRLFGTYRDRPADGHEAMEIGLLEDHDSSRQTLAWALARPFRSRADAARAPGELRILADGLERWTAATRSPRRRSRS